MQKGARLEIDKLRAQLTLAGYQHVTQVVAAGDTACAAGWSTCSRWVPPCPTASNCSTTRSRPCAASTSIRSARSIRCPKSACCRHANFPPARPGAPRSASASAKPSRATPRASAFTRTSRTEYSPPASSTTCRCSSIPPRRCSTIYPSTPHCCCTVTCQVRSPSSGPIPRVATRCWAVTARARCCRRPTCSCATRSSLLPQRRYRNWS
jgi:hypothetical protein